MDGKLKHLELIQSVIDRMARNSSLLKGWAATVVTGLYALTFDDITGAHVLLSTFLTAYFALLDSYYLAKERAFRNLYEETAAKNEADIDFSMKRENTDRLGDWFDAFLSTTIWLFYGGLIAAQLLFAYFI